MRLGAVLPQLEIGSDPAVIAKWARAVEGMGYRHVLAYDHVLGADPAARPGWRGYTNRDSFHEVFVLFGYLAAITETLELVTGVLILPQRQTALVAKQAAEVDVLSRGRLRLGIGVGWNPVEYEALNEDFGTRGARSEEQIEVLRALWAEPTITYRGRWHTIVDAGIEPRPPRGGIPIWIGGTADAVLRRAARIGDGWLPQQSPNAESAATLQRIREYAEEAGRSPDDIGIEARLTLSNEPRAGWADFIAGWDDLGATHLCVNTMGMGFTDIDQHLEALAEVI
jgi:probable F420-dependent oxidoreductase